MPEPINPFFQSGPASNSDYVFNRDDESRQDVRESIERRWEAYCAYCGDSHFLQLAKNDFNGTTWQLYLASELMSQGHSLQKTGPDEPDLKTDVKGRTCWIEVTACTPGHGINEVPKLDFGSIDAEKIKLRMTSQIQEKALGDQIQRWKQKEIVEPDNLYILALNGSAVPNADMFSNPSLIEQCLFGIGPFVFRVQVGTGKLLYAGHTVKVWLEKRLKSGKVTNVPNNYFLNGPGLEHVSAIVYSHLSIVNSIGLNKFGTDITVIHNPNATNKLPRGFFKFGSEVWVTKGGRLKRRMHRRWNFKWQASRLKSFLHTKWWIFQNRKFFDKQRKPFT